MDWKYEVTPDGKVKLVKYEEDHIDDAQQLARLLNQLLQERKLLEKDLATLDKKIAAVKAALDEVMAAKTKTKAKKESN